MRLLALSDNTNELDAFNRFYLNVLENHPTLAIKIADNIPNTDLGNKLTETLFKCSVVELKEQARNTPTASVSNTSAEPPNQVKKPNM